jgi:hypothetical protein
MTTTYGQVWCLGEVAGMMDQHCCKSDVIGSFKGDQKQLHLDHEFDIVI